MSDKQVVFTTATGTNTLSDVVEGVQGITQQFFGDTVIGAEEDIRSVMEPGDRLVKITFEVVGTATLHTNEGEAA